MERDSERKKEIEGAKKLLLLKQNEKESSATKNQPQMPLARSLLNSFKPQPLSTTLHGMGLHEVLMVLLWPVL